MFQILFRDGNNDPHIIERKFQTVGLAVDYIREKCKDGFELHDEHVTDDYAFLNMLHEYGDMFMFEVVVSMKEFDL